MVLLQVQLNREHHKQPDRRFAIRDTPEPSLPGSWLPRVTPNTLTLFLHQNYCPLLSHRAHPFVPRFSPLQACLRFRTIERPLSRRSNWSSFSRELVGTTRWNGHRRGKGRAWWATAGYCRAGWGVPLFWLTIPTVLRDSFV